MTQVSRRLATTAEIRLSMPSLESSSSAEVGSSSSNTAGELARARARATRCASPPERLWTSRLENPSRPTCASRLSIACLGERLALLRGAEADIFRHCSGKEKCRLHHHAHAAAELGGRQRAIVLAGEVNGSAGRLVKPIEQAQQRRFAGAARSDNGRDLAFGDFQVDIVEDALAFNFAPKMFGAEDGHAFRRALLAGFSRADDQQLEAAAGAALALRRRAAGRSGSLHRMRRCARRGAW